MVRPPVFMPRRRRFDSCPWSTKFTYYINPCSALVNYNERHLE